MATRTLHLFAAAILGTALAGSAQAAYPEKPITLIVPFAPGGGTDLSARLIVPYIEKNLGGQIVILNRPGAGGEVGATEIAAATPDGYTIGFMNVPNTLTKPFEREARYTVDSFEPIANMVFDPAVLAALPNSRFATLEDVVTAAKDEPGGVSVSSAGIGSNTHLDLMLFEQMAGVTFLHVPFDGGAASRNALLGGHVDLSASALGDMHRFAEEGQILILGVQTEERIPTSPEVPTFAELGYPLINGSARGLVGPSGMPEDAVAAIAAAVEQALQDPELIAEAEKIALPLRYMGTEEYAEYLQSSYRSIGELWEASPWAE